MAARHDGRVLRSRPDCRIAAVATKVMANVYSRNTRIRMKLRDLSFLRPVKVWMREPEDCQGCTTGRLHTSSGGSHRALWRGEACRILRPRYKRFLDLWVGLVAGHDWIRFLVSRAKVDRGPGWCSGLQATALMDLNDCKVCRIRASLFCCQRMLVSEERKDKNERRRALIDMRRICPLRYGPVTSFVALLTNIPTAYHEQTFGTLRTSPSVQYTCIWKHEYKPRQRDAVVL
jgi:hypothetical protein